MHIWDTIPRHVSVFITGALLIAGCDALGSDDSRFYDVVTRFEADENASATAGFTSKQATRRTYRLSDDDLRDAACGDGQIICLTPQTLAGRIYSGGLMVGGVERPGYHITTIGATQEVRLRPDLGRTGTLTFDVAGTTDLSGAYSCCEGSPYPEDDEALISRIEMNFDYLDVTFTVPNEAGGSLAGRTYVLRQVYVDTTTAPDVNGETYAGDKLIRRADEQAFRWCDADDCDHTERPAEGVLQASNVELEPDIGGNAHYATFSIPLENNETVSFTREEAEQDGWRFNVAFELTDAAVFEFTDWTAAADEHDIVRAFHLIHDVNAAHSSVRVQLSKEKVQVDPVPEE